MISRRALLLSLATAGAAFGCKRRNSEGGVAQEMRDAAALRIVSVSASTTEALFAIGAGAQVVGRSRYDDYPKEALALPTVGGFVDPNLEAILALRPDLVVGARGPMGPGIVKTLEEHGIATWFPETETIAGIYAMIEGLGARSGHVAEAGALVAKMKARGAAIAQALNGLPQPKVLLLFDTKPIVAAGPGSFVDEMLRLAGGRNALLDGARYATLALETVLTLDPDVILDAEMTPSPQGFDDTWKSVRAVRDGKVTLLRDEAILRPGPRVFEGIATLARTLHPSASP